MWAWWRSYGYDLLFCFWFVMFFGSEIFCCWLSWYFIFVFLDLIICCFWLLPLFLDLVFLFSLLFRCRGRLSLKKEGGHKFFQIQEGDQVFFFNLRKGMWFVYVFHIWERCHHGGCVGVIFVGFHRCHHRGSCSGVTSIDPWWL